ncbi:2OG-Fe dioxygenase family protein [Caldimonas manganoxidans]|uniref:2OG-Fe dioxygenase family protein n=1 Tax=Caldimonas manganoxidans TaxID=196015 RepID=UPI000374CB50|nr:2OG-Fe dioxygenase family protein [Caldimonas manganoxidans]
MLLPPPVTPPTLVDDALRDRGFAVLDAPGLAAFCGVGQGGFAELSPLWGDLPLDAYLRDGGRYRRRRHTSLVLEEGQLRMVPHRAHWQPVEYNALHGGMERWFEPVSDRLLQAPAFVQLMHALGRCASGLKGEQPWYVEVHQFRIDTTDGIGRPTPEGAHRDGVDLVAVVLVARSGIKGGETRVFEAHGSHGIRFTLTEPWSALLLDDERVIHESTPIQPLDGPGYRDTLVVTLRAGGFQGP